MQIEINHLVCPKDQPYILHEVFMHRYSYNYKRTGYRICAECRVSPNKNSILVCREIGACCNEVQVLDGDDDKVKSVVPKIFTTYTKEPDIINGHVHYTSVDGRKAIAFNDEDKEWKIQLVSHRY